MNVRDSEVICGLLQTMNYELTTNPDGADILIFNTCSVRQHAEDKVWSEIGRMKKKGPSLALRTNHPRKKIIGVIGCMAQNYKEKIFERAPNVDFVVGPSDIHKIPDIINKFAVPSSEFGVKPLLERKIWETEGEGRPDEIYHTGFYADQEHAYVVISEGCSNCCSYCVVPHVRGALRNRHHQDILKEIEKAMEKGITKVTLLGQNVNAYQFGARSSEFGVDFVKLLEMVNQVKGLEEFGFITSHPKDTTLEVFKAMVNLKKLKKYLHLPVQSGSDRILELMNRRYTRKMYLELADNYRKMVPGGALTTDIIVGYPTETEKDFQETYDLVKEIQFNAAFIFKYSVRLHTQAATSPDDVPKVEKERRHRIVLDLQKEISKNVKKS
ncbi:MAG: tRNA (N6-isopentenyl adenosine(37)-C2)-methylthiotransferase MiaB [Candidatus Omnitrophota bacterium]